MNRATLVRKGVFRHRLRAGLLLFTIAIAFVILGVLMSVHRALNTSVPPSGVNRLVVSNRINYTQPLPIDYVRRVAAVPGVTAVSHQSWLGSYYRDPRNFFVTYAVAPSTFLPLYPDKIVLLPDQAAAFAANRSGMIVGEALAHRFGWRIGQRIPVLSNIYTRPDGGPWVFTICGIFRAGQGRDAANVAYVAYDMFNETRSFSHDYVGSVIARTRASGDNAAVARAIDATFANSPFETVTQDENTFGRAFLSQFGNIDLMITLVVGAAFGAILLIVGNTMTMSVRERTSEIGVMKTLGFSSGSVLGLVLAESVLTTVVGASIGLAVAGLALRAIAGLLPAQFGGLSLNMPTLALSFLVALGLGLATGLVPALLALRMTPIRAIGH